MNYALLVLLVAAASAELAPLLKAKEKVDGQYIIKMKDSVNVSLLADNPFFTKLGGRSQHRYNRVLRGFSAFLSKDALDYVRRSDLVDYVEENEEVRLDYSWGIDRVNQHNLCLDLDVDFTTGSTGYGANVFVIDSGISPNHIEFGDRATVAADFVYWESQNGIDCHGHGTHCSGTVGSKSYGVAPRTLIHGVRTIDCTGHGTSAEVIAACDFVADSPLTLKVASISLGFGVSTSVNDAIQRMIDANVAVAVSAGNENFDACNKSPASAPNALTVGATDQNDVRATFSNYGSCVDIFAPGVSITSTFLNGGVASWSGTSMAAPHAAGVMALKRVANPCLTGQEIIDLVKAEADKQLVADPRFNNDSFLFCS